MHVLIIFFFHFFFLEFHERKTKWMPDRADEVKSGQSDAEDTGGKRCYFNCTNNLF